MISRISQTLAEIREENRKLLTEVEAKRVFQEVGLRVVDAQLAMSKEQAIAISEEIGFPVALKVVSPRITHKSDAGGVRLNLNSAEEVGEAFDEIKASALRSYPDAAIHGVSVQRMAKPGLEVIIGMTRDAQFGPVLMFGLGGILVEILKDVSFAITPLTKRDAREMIQEIKGHSLLEGYRGLARVDIQSLESWLLKLSEFVRTYPDIAEFDLNPVFAYSDGAAVVDARIVLT